MTTRKWLRWILLGGVLLLAVSFGFSRALHSKAARRYLIAHLAASFGRPVDVSWFDFSLLDGARIEAHLVSVSDDPQFGSEYFLRADTLTAGVRWTSLLAGRFEFGSVSLARPSLNLTRDAEGRWNIERWLPPASQSGARPGFVGPVTPFTNARATRPARIDVDGGRINFKQGYNKSPFALVDVTGRVEQSDAGRWQIDLAATPMRAGVELQEMGTLRLRGSIAGTTARLQPANLNLTWRAASLADALRLLRQNDYGMRGQLAVDLNARIAPQESAPASGAEFPAAQWSVSAVARLTGMHGWRLPGHSADPAANLALEMNWRLGQRHADIRKLVVELPASHLQGTAELDWAHGLQPQLRIESSTLALGDALAWYRALRPDVADDLRTDGVLGVDLKLGGWPLQVQQGTVTSAGGMLAAKALAAPLQIGALKASVSRGGFDFAPTVISFVSAAVPAASTADPPSSAPRNSFVVQGSLMPRTGGVFRWPPDWNLFVEGSTPRVQDWLALSAAFAQPANANWRATGGLALKIRGTRVANSPAEQGAIPATNAWNIPWRGSMDLADLTISPAYLNQPVLVAKAHVDFAPLQRTLSVSSAEAFGAVWRGSVARKSSDSLWTFDLSADHLDALELDRWLGPRARPGFLARFAGLNTAAAASVPPPDAVLTQLSARGRLHAAAIDLPPMRLEQVDGEVEIDGREIRIRKAAADFFGGKVSGSLNARLVPDPAYEFDGRLDRVDLARLAGAVPILENRLAGTASGALQLSAHGIGRQSLVASLQGQGTLTGKNVQLRGLNLSTAFSGAAPEGDTDAFASVQGNYRVLSGGIDLAGFVLDNSRGKLQADGRIEFSHALNVRLRPSIFQAAADGAAASPPGLVLGGTIESPKLLLSSANPKTAARTNSR
ncbi:MAG TPA: AsmA-like C-terminal region-containing protein [Candidatus Acidoferrales bacterium]|nr:AsmA-like C-terminal region-containing protein [Candidatus Acidoferrales bacterium]